MSETLPTPNWALGYVPPPSEWSNWWASKFGCVPTSITATGTTQAGAAPLQSHMVVITSASAANEGIIATLGYHEIWNDSGYPVLFYPQSGVAFRGLTANQPYILPYYSGGSGPVKMLLLNTSQGYVG
jgi:hypothetical protein